MIPNWLWVLLGGMAVGLIVAHMIDVIVASLRRWWIGEPEILAHFSPRGGSQAVLVQAIQVARREILLQAYSFTCREIAEALIAAASRGVKVVVLLDRRNETETSCELGDLKYHGIQLKLEACPGTAHNKVMIIDGSTVITGNFRLTHQTGLETEENLLVLRNHLELAEKYRVNFHAHHEPVQLLDPAPFLVLNHRQGG